MEIFFPLDAELLQDEAFGATVAPVAGGSGSHVGLLLAVLAEPVATSLCFSTPGPLVANRSEVSEHESLAWVEIDAVDEVREGNLF